MPDKALGHYTHEKNPVACAAALAAIEVIESDHLLDNAVKMGNHAVERMKRMADTFSMIGDVRGKGLLMGMELLKDQVTAERAIEEAEGVMYAALTKGLNFKITMGNILTLTPPLTITETEMNAALDILQESLHEVFAR